MSKASPPVERFPKSQRGFPGIIQARFCSREVRIRVPTFFLFVYLSSGTLLHKTVRKGTTGGPRKGTDSNTTHPEGVDKNPWMVEIEIHTTHHRTQKPWFLRRFPCKYRRAPFFSWCQSGANGCCLDTAPSKTVNLLLHLLKSLEKIKIVPVVIDFL